MAKHSASPRRSGLLLKCKNTLTLVGNVVFDVPCEVAQNLKNMNVRASLPYTTIFSILAMFVSFENLHLCTQFLFFRALVRIL